MTDTFTVPSAETVFEVPKNLQEAEERLGVLRLAVAALEGELAQKHVRNPQTGERLSTIEYFEWKRRARAALMRKMREVNYLKSWASLQGKAPLTPMQVRAKTALGVLCRCSAFLHRLRDEGVEFTPEEQQLLAEVDDVAGLGAASFLREARACRDGNSENIFLVGGLIARATMDDQDLAELAREWEKVNANTPRDENLIAKCAVAYTHPLGHVGRIDDAVAVTRQIDQNQRSAAYAWSNVAFYSGDPAILEHARALGRDIPAGQREWFFLNLYMLMGRQEDADLAALGTEPESLVGKKREWFKVLLVKDYAKWGRLEEARALCRSLRGTENHMHALAYIVERSEEEDEARGLASALKLYKPAKVPAMKCVASVLARHGYGDHVRAMLDSMRTWHLKCAGYSALARVMQSDAAGLLDQAEQALLASGFVGDTCECQALTSLAYAQALHGNPAKAIRTAQMIRVQDARCATFLALDALSRGDDIPEFLEEMI